MNISNEHSIVITQTNLPGKTLPSSPEISIKELMQKPLFSIHPEGKSLHGRAALLPYFVRINNSSISANSLLLYLTNNASIYLKIETYIKANKALEDIWNKDLFRSPCLEKDIAFLINKLNLQRPILTIETEQCLKFIDETAAENPHLLLAIIFVLHYGLLQGRNELRATSVWMKKMISGWESLPDSDNGTCFWQYRDIPANENPTLIKEQFTQKINEYGNELKIKDPAACQKLPEIARKTFEHVSKSIQSSTPSEIPKLVSNITFVDDYIPPLHTKMMRVFMLVTVLSLIIKMVAVRDLT